jgi:SAM-dependent methyltransferase
MPDEFQGTPYRTKPTDDWNRPAVWRDYYLELQTATPWRREAIIHRSADLLLRMLSQAGELPLSSPRKLLDAGCGIALIPHLFAYWGFQVTAVDSCAEAIETTAKHSPSEAELAKCIPIWDPCPDRPGTYKLIDDPARSLAQLRSYQAPGGSVSISLNDWFTAELTPAAFAVVHCRNSLRCSTKDYWRRSLSRFYELLSPGGLLLLETVNAIGIQDEVQELLAECQFVPLKTGTSRDSAHKYVIDMWPTG